jgi:polysaccharide deacetylase 2 family uncharacterized protein YibQ
MFIILTEQAITDVRANLKMNSNEKLLTIYPEEPDKETKDRLKQAVSAIDGYVEVKNNIVTKTTRTKNCSQSSRPKTPP